MPEHDQQAQELTPEQEKTLAALMERVAFIDSMDAECELVEDTFRAGLAARPPVQVEVERPDELDRASRIVRGLLYNDDERGPGEWEAEAARFLSGAVARLPERPDEGLAALIESALTDPAPYCERVQHEYSALHDTEPLLAWQTRAVLLALAARPPVPEEKPNAD